MSWSRKNSAHKLFRILFINFGLLVSLVVVAEIVLHLVYTGGNPFLAPVKNELRVRDPHHTDGLKPNFNGFDAWGSNIVPIFTNSLGFRDVAVRSVPMTADRKRVIFIGDSFTENPGVPYEQSFVGLFAQAFPALDVLNAGVSSYAPSVYYEKLKYLLDAGLKFDEAVVYIDISDIQDEGVFYSYDQNGVLQMGVFQPTANVCSPSRGRRCHNHQRGGGRKSLIWRSSMARCATQRSWGERSGERPSRSFQNRASSTAPITRVRAGHIARIQAATAR